MVVPIVAAIERQNSSDFEEDEAQARAAEAAEFYCSCYGGVVYYRSKGKPEPVGDLAGYDSGSF